MRIVNPRAGFAVLAVVAIVAAVGVITYAVTGTSSGSGTNAHWWNPTTWGKHAPAAKVDQAQAQVTKAVAVVDTAKENAVHAAHVEIKKASVAQVSLPPSQATDLDRRFTTNGLMVLDQVDPLTGAETAQALTIVQGELGQEVTKRQAAEKAQLAAEKQLGVVSTSLSTAQGQLKAKDDALAAAQTDLRTHFDQENALANKLRNQTFLERLAIGLVVALCLFALYLRIGLGSVGAALQPLQKVLAPADYQKVVTAMDSSTDWLHQVLISAGKKKAMALEAKAQAVLGISPAQPPSTTT